MPNETPLRVALPIGIGDSLWSCMKLRALSAMHDNRPIHAYINRSANHQSVHFLQMVPFIAKAVQSPDAPWAIEQQMPPNHQHPKWATLDGCRGWNGFDYIVVPNGWLETGNRIETFFPELATEHSFPLNIPQEAIEKVAPFAGRVLVYMSGTGPNFGFHRGLWSVSNWIEVIHRLNQAGISPVLVGANTADDLGYRDAFMVELQKQRWLEGLQFEDYTGQTSLPEYCAIMRAASCWIGMNSGGGIASAMMGTPTVMLWSDSAYPIPGVRALHLPLHTNMQRSWLRDDQLTTYRTLSFGSPTLTPENVVAAALEVKR